MLDHRCDTFLELCRERSYTRAAERLNMTQPGVTQHIQYLERAYGGKLFSYRNRALTLTERGERLYELLSRQRADDMRAREMLRSMHAPTPVRFGATLTIGEYAMPPVLRRLIEETPDMQLTMQVGNTRMLLELLHRGEIDFALVEGIFDRAAYLALPLRREDFIAVCAPASPLPDNARWERVLAHRLILREPGSGTRDVLEKALAAHNLGVDSFAHRVEVGNMSAIKQLVAADMGVSFLYRAAAAREIREGSLRALRIEGFAASHAFYFVALAGSAHEAERLRWYERMARGLGDGACGPQDGAPADR